MDRWVDRWKDGRWTEFSSGGQCLSNNIWLTSWSKNNGPFPRATERQESLNSKDLPSAKVRSRVSEKSSPKLPEKSQMSHKGTVWQQTGGQQGPGTALRLPTHLLKNKPERRAAGREGLGWASRLGCPPCPQACQLAPQSLCE